MKKRITEIQAKSRDASRLFTNSNLQESIPQESVELISEKVEALESELMKLGKSTEAFKVKLLPEL